MLTVKDEAGQTIQIKANDAERLSNKMTRDYEFDQAKESAKAIAVSSFAVVHQVSTPLCYSTSGRYDDNWSKASARSYRQLVNLANNIKD